METIAFWEKISAIGQVAGAIATFAAVVVSLYIARRGRVPRLSLKVGERLTIGGGLPEQRLLMFSVTNMGERPVYVRQLGWRNGWLPHGPAWLDGDTLYNSPVRCRLELTPLIKSSRAKKSRRLLLWKTF